VPALPLDEVRRFVDATRPIFASVKKRPDQPAYPANQDAPSDADSEVGFDLTDAPPTAVRSAEGIPFPTRPAPDDD
jgi:D-aminopeptidase